MRIKYNVPRVLYAVDISKCSSERNNKHLDEIISQFSEAIVKLNFDIPVFGPQPLSRIAFLSSNICFSPMSFSNKILKISRRIGPWDTTRISVPSLLLINSFALSLDKKFLPFFPHHLDFLLLVV